MLADFELNDLKPFFWIGLAVVVGLVRLLGSGKKLLQDTWTDESWQPRAPGDARPGEEPTVIGRHSRTPAPAAPSSPLPRPAAPRAPGAWEAELERILRGETARPAAPPPLPPPPQPAPAPAYRPRPVTFDYNSDSDIESAPAPSTALATMSESAANQRRADAAYGEGASLHEQVVQRMRQINSQVVKHAAASSTGRADQRNAAGTEATAVRAWLKQPDTARAAFIAATVFGPPKALEA